MSGDWPAAIEKVNLSPLQSKEKKNPQTTQTPQSSKTR